MTQIKYRPCSADKTDVITECKRQANEKEVYKQLSQEEAEQLIQVKKKAGFYYCEETHHTLELFK